MSLEPTFKRFDVREISTDNSGQDTIWDSGAKDNVTGDRCALHDFKELAKPIPVNVATNSPRNYIKGTGTLKFARTNSMIIVVKRVHYCENARLTLLSIAAFKKSDRCFDVKDNFDTIELLNALGKVIL